MTTLSDTIQIALNFGLPGALTLALLLWVLWRSFWAVSGFLWGALLKIIPPLKWGSLAWLGAFGFILWAFNVQIAGLLEDVEYRYLEPVLVNETPVLDDETLIRVYESEIRKHTSEAEFQIVRDSTRATAARIGTAPVAIYEAAWLECGLNPFRVRDDKVAAGWIQFTDAGCAGLPFTKQDVIRACQTRHTAFIMSATDRYLRRKADRLPDDVSLRNTIDLYLAIFAPAYVGAGPDKVVYAGFSNPVYYKNSGLDGWCVDGGKIVRSRSAVDGKITAYEIFLCLQRKKALLLKNRI